jgi:hypothetical protein
METMFHLGVVESWFRNPLDTRVHPRGSLPSAIRVPTICPGKLSIWRSLVAVASFVGIRFPSFLPGQALRALRRIEQGREKPSMKRISWHLIVPLVLGALAAPIACVEGQNFIFEPGAQGGGGTGGTGGMTSSSGEGGMGTSSSSTSSSSGMVECTTPQECISTECRTATGCNTSTGKCMWQNVSEGTVTASQLFGDCKDRVCDGNGGVKLNPGDPTKDTYDWANPCYVNSCMAFPDPLAVPDADLKVCTTPWGNTMGHCSNFQCIDCMMDTDCVAPMHTCQNKRCIPDECADGVKNGVESDIDCGGTACLPCAADRECGKDLDCEGLCVDMMGIFKCVAPSCADSRLNNDETDVDCGGKCVLEMPPKGCATDQKCIFHKDCASGVCKSGMCQAPSCSDQVQNQDEAGVDCGGACGGMCPPASP